MSNERLAEANRLILMLTLALADVCERKRVNTDKIGLRDAGQDGTISLSELLQRALDFHRESEQPAGGERPN